ncbi:MAG: RnfH family protein [Pseudomonadota bacterium]|nr:RnfH family protein [Pseudomonadota bacterium]
MLIQVILADEESQKIYEYDLPTASKIKRLLNFKEVLKFRERNGPDCSIIISGEKVSPEHYLKPFDRVEFLRPLKKDPKEWRRTRKKNLNRC